MQIPKKYMFFCVLLLIVALAVSWFAMKDETAKIIWMSVEGILLLGIIIRIIYIIQIKRKEHIKQTFIGNKNEFTYNRRIG